MIKIELPYPYSELNPNKRLHWARLDKFKGKYRAECQLLTLSQLKGFKLEDSKRLLLDIVIVLPDKRKRDDDNAIASFKAGRDGLSDALGVDDYYFTCRYMVDRRPVKGGKVIVKIKEYSKVDWENQLDGLS